ncbi:hypothetical protein [Intestinirhabdus alba]|uniref:Uncharacterized protein n=1 Tax=Intestinirhabdus alba TaxID=2899544 RepID=A0A6L6IVG1_9ENTR|nr:hypothetical protein [Intestinirhabdus alba]MTH48723.1 hypothetical protein [Intestinirhabdus alba]
MPVELKNIPERIKTPEPPIVLRWLIIIILVTVVGAALALFLWPEGISTHSAWFWFSVIAVPFSVGSACYAFRLLIYENERERVNHWNRLHQEQYDIQVAKGQRCAGLLGKAYITPGACNKLASALLTYGSQLQSTYFAPLRRTFTTARLEPSASHFSKESYSLRLARYLAQLLSVLEPDLSALAGDRLSVRLRHDGMLDDAHIRQIWQEIFPSLYTVDDLAVGEEGDGMMWLDSWLDRREAMLMLSVEINLFTEPRDYQSESVSALLLASPEWLSQHVVQPEAVIHRPVVATEEICTLQDMLRWGKLSIGEAYTLWQEQVDKNALTRLLQQAESIGYAPGQSEKYILDDLFGNAGAAHGNIALLCACEYAVTSGKPQWVMISDKTTHQTIVRQAEC